VESKIEWDGPERRKTHDERLTKLETQMDASLKNQEDIKKALESLTLQLSKYTGFAGGVAFVVSVIWGMFTVFHKS